MMFAQVILACALLAPPPPTVAVPAVHCQVPCGIYGDHLRIERLLEDAATIEKAMAEINTISAADQPNWNQLVRWVTTKENHAQAVQDQVSAYWLAQRIKEPISSFAKEASTEAYKRYTIQLVASHHIITCAMKCKQSTDVAQAESLREAVRELKTVYFSADDQKHLHEHSAGEKVDILDGLTKAKMKVAQTDVLLLSNAVESFILNNGMTPSSLELLVEKDSRGASYLSRDDVPVDPWGNQYVLVEDEEHFFDIRSYGSDGKAGGTGAAADISRIGMRTGAIKRIR